MTGVYSRIRPQFQRSEIESPAVFLDRDGVIAEETGYLSRAEDLRFVDGTEEAIRAFNHAGLPVVVVTNQAGVGRGYYTWAEFERVQRALEEGLERAGAWIDAVWACAYHGDGIEEFRIDDHSHRKPNAGMLMDAAAHMNLCLQQSWMVGDKTSDLEAGLAAGVRAALHVETGYGKEQRAEIRTRFAHAESAIEYCSDLREAASFILKNYSLETNYGKS